MVQNKQVDKEILRLGAAFDSGATAGLTVLMCMTSAIGLSLFGANAAMFGFIIVIAGAALPFILVIRTHLLEWTETDKPVVIGWVIFIITLFSPAIFAMSVAFLLLLPMQRKSSGGLTNMAKHTWYSSQGRHCTP